MEADTNSPIEIVPAIRRLRLARVGCWQEMTLEFLSGLNIITEEGSAWGKTTILRAILQSFLPSIKHKYPLRPTIGFKEGQISIEFMKPSITFELSSFNHLYKQHTDHQGVGRFMLEQLYRYLSVTPKDMAVLIEDEVTAVLDVSSYRKAVDLLNQASCQIICIISHRIDFHDFPEARIYSCSVNQDGKTTNVKLLQLGRAGG